MPRFSIVVTTTDRQPLLATAIRSVLATGFDDFELIISDNFSQPSTEPIVVGFDDPRLRFVRTDGRMAVADHWEFAWQHVRGDFVIYLGDDNALHPGILGFADRALKQHGLEMIAWRLCSYFHPDWNLAYGGLPRRGNILTFAPGATGHLYRADPAAILRSYCAELRLGECFPGMISLFSRERAEAIRRRTGRVFWPLAPDVAVAYFLLGTIRPDAFAFLDGYGAIGGRSRDSSVAAFLSKGKKSRRADELFTDHAGTDHFPHHPVKFRSMANILAATISQAAALIPEQFAPYRYSPRTLALETIDDIYTRHITPWADDPRFVAEVESFLATLPADVRREVTAYRDRCIARQAETERALMDGQGQPPDDRRLWAVDSIYYLDMAAFGAHDIAATAQRLPQVLGLLDRDSDRFVRRSRASGQIGDRLSAAGSWRDEGLEAW